MPTKTSLTLLALVALTLVTFAGVTTSDFINLDDPFYITANPHVNTGLTWNNFVWAWTNLDAGLWQPLVWLSFQVDASLFDMRPGWFHIVNLAWHAANVCLLYLVLARLTDAPLRSALVAALFAVHPLHVESVAWVTERKDVLSGFFAILTLWFYVNYAKPRGESSNPAGRAWTNYGLATLSLFLGLASKPMLVTWPCVLLLLDYWPLGRVSAALAGGARLQGVGRLLVEKLPLFGLCFVAGALTVAAHSARGGIASTEDLPFDLRLANALFSLGWYVVRTVWPVDLGAFYPHPRLSLGADQVLLSVAGLLAVLIFLWCVRRRRPEQVVGWLWFLGALVPVLGLVQAGDAPRADRFVYLPHIGLFIAFVWGAGDLLVRVGAPRPARVGLAMAVVFFFAVLSWRQVGYWHDEEALWTHTLEVSGPENYRANGQLGSYCYFQGDKAKASVYLARACTDEMAISEFGLLRGTLLNEQEKYSEAVPYLQGYLARHPGDADACYNLGLAFFHLGYFREATHHWQKVLETRPGTPGLYLGLGVSLLGEAKRAEAMPYLRRAVELRGGWAAAHFHLGKALLEERQLEEARLHLAESLRLEPDLAEARSLMQKLAGK